MKIKQKKIKKLRRIRKKKINNKLKNKQKILENEMNQLAEKISKIREENASSLSKKINKELQDLEMKNAKINVKVESQEEFNENGKDKVEIYIKTNIGEAECELIKISSGGEQSRIMLAIKKVLSETDKMPILVFDEIDTGISGKRIHQKFGYS